MILDKCAFYDATRAAALLRGCRPLSGAVDKNTLIGAGRAGLKVFASFVKRFPAEELREFKFKLFEPFLSAIAYCIGYCYILSNTYF